MISWSSMTCVFSNRLRLRFKLEAGILLTRQISEYVSGIVELWKGKNPPTPSVVERAGYPPSSILNHTSYILGISGCSATAPWRTPLLTPPFLTVTQVGIHELLGHGSGKLYHQGSDDAKALIASGEKHPLTGEAISGPFYAPGATWDTTFGKLASPYEECRAECAGIFLCLEASVLTIFGHEADATDQAVHDVRPANAPPARPRRVHVDDPRATPRRRERTVGRRLPARRSRTSIGC